MGARRSGVCAQARNAPSMVLTCVLAESCMSAGPKSVAPVSRPETARMTLCIRCSMNGRATTIRMSVSRSPYVTLVSDPELNLLIFSAASTHLLRGVVLPWPMSTRVS